PVPPAGASSLAVFGVSGLLRINVPKRSKVIREIGCIEYLNASMVLSIKRGHGTQGTHPHRVRGCIEPQTQVVSLDRISRRIRRSIRKWLAVEHERSRCGARRHDKGLYAETTDEDFMTDAVAVGLDIALVPGKAKRCMRYLDDEEIKVSVRR